MTQSTENKYVIVALSGGVDSAVAAFLLKEQGYKVSAIFMKNWEETGEAICQSSLDFIDAQHVCDQLKIELHSINCAQEYWEKVFINFLTEYKAGNTPNPDILCNKEIKFTVFLQYAQQLGADYIATGHYARTRNVHGQIQLLKALDQHKDQSYFLYTLDQQQLSKVLFPVGNMAKSQVRALAQKINLINHAKKDSVGICFIGKRNFRDFLQQYLPAVPGHIVTSSGKIIGEHQGLIFYTIGQRKGLHIGGQADFLPGPWYVIAKNLANNSLIVAQDHEQLSYSNSLTATNVHWINQQPNTDLVCNAKIRYRQIDQVCTVVPMQNNKLHVNFLKAQKAIAPGQSIVFYENEVCLGGGIINHLVT